MVVERKRTPSWLVIWLSNLPPKRRRRPQKESTGKALLLRPILTQVKATISPRVLLQ